MFRTPTLAVRVQLPLGWNTYLLFNTDTINFAWKTDGGDLTLHELSVDEEWWGWVENLT